MVFNCQDILCPIYKRRAEKGTYTHTHDKVKIKQKKKKKAIKEKKNRKTSNI